jgi:3-hydroxybutyryl-CoA dehydrogenase
MGCGIAQAAASAGWTVYLFDIEKELLEAGIKRIKDRYERLVQKNRITSEEASQTQSRILPKSSLAEFEQCDLVIEAATEQFETKVKILQQVGVLSPQTVIATNTSSLSVSELAKQTDFSKRIVGLHFFNPAPTMPLVEAIQGEFATDEALSRATLLAECWGKTVVRVSDSPGFIVNRIARQYYLEAWRIVEDKLATVDEVDTIMQTFGEFRMGPFELMDMLGQDVSCATTRQIWQRLGKPSRLAPCPMQEALVAKGHVGKSSGCGAYAHDDQNNVSPAIITERIPLEIHDALRSALCDFCLEATPIGGNILEQYVFARILASIMNEAMWAQTEEIASPEDIDTAMKLGTNYPSGPLEWAKRIGEDRVRTVLTELNATVSDDRFIAPPRPVTI